MIVITYQIKEGEGTMNRRDLTYFLVAYELNHLPNTAENDVPVIHFKYLNQYVGALIWSEII